MLRRIGKTDCPDSDTGSKVDPEKVESDCFLCEEKFYLDNNVYNKHLEEKHMVIFGLKEIRECGEEDEKKEQIPELQPMQKQAVTHYNMNPLAFKILVMHSKSQA